MPSFSNASPRQWAQVRASTSMSTYAVLDGLKDGPKRREDLSPHLARALPDLIEAEWIAEGENGELGITEDGRAHLRSF